MDPIRQSILEQQGLAGQELPQEHSEPACHRHLKDDVQRSGPSSHASREYLTCHFGHAAP